MRGGSEYGEAWHKAGMFEKKQNVFDDFIAAGEYLIKREVHVAARSSAINGGSNGGLLVGAVMTQRPDLFAVALPQVGVMDMLRYHKFTGGGCWATEYGTSDDSGAFALPARVFAAAEHQAGRLLSGDARHDGRPRRPRRAEPFVQVRGDDADGAAAVPMHRRC